jgi:hypothetical protein
MTDEVKNKLLTISPATIDRILKVPKQKYDAAKPPYQRMLERDDVPRDTKLALIEMKTATDLMQQKLLRDSAITILFKSAQALSSTV